MKKYPSKRRLSAVVLQSRKSVSFLPSNRHHQYTELSVFFSLSTMKKLSLLLGTLGGAVAGYVFSNTKLRDDLAKAKDAETAGKIFAKHLKQDGEQIGHEVMKFAKSDVVQDNMQKAREYVKDNARTMQKQLKTMISKEKPKVAKKAAAMKKSVKKAVARKMKR